MVAHARTVRSAPLLQLESQALIPFDAGRDFFAPGARRRTLPSRPPARRGGLVARLRGRRRARRPAPGAETARALEPNREPRTAARALPPGVSHPDADRAPERRVGGRLRFRGRPAVLHDGTGRRPSAGGLDAARLAAARQHPARPLLPAVALARAALRARGH